MKYYTLIFVATHKQRLIIQMLSGLNKMSRHFAILVLKMFYGHAKTHLSLQDFNSWSLIFEKVENSPVCLRISCIT